VWKTTNHVMTTATATATATKEEEKVLVRKCQTASTEFPVPLSGAPSEIGFISTVPYVIYNKWASPFTIVAPTFVTTEKGRGLQSRPGLFGSVDLMATPSSIWGIFSLTPRAATAALARAATGPTAGVRRPCVRDGAFPTAAITSRRFRRHLRFPFTHNVPLFHHNFKDKVRDRHRRRP